MLNSILIRNIVLIDQLQINFNGQFCVLTGETGSGKSILLDALGLAIGYRSNNRLLKEGTKEGMVVAEFDISKNSSCQNIMKELSLFNPDDPDILVLRRVLQESSSRAFVNDIAVNINILKRIGETLIEIHGQNEQSNLLNPSYHLEILDNYAKNENLLLEVNNNFTDLSKINNKLQKLEEEKERNEREKDYLQFIIKELKNANVEIQEEEELTKKRHLITNQEKIHSSLQEILSEINNADNNIITAIKNINRNQNLVNSIYDNNFIKKLDELSTILDLIATKNDEAKSIIENILSDIDIGDLSLDFIEERLLLIRSLVRKFNINSNELPKFLQEAQEKLEIVENFSLMSEDLKKKKEYLQEQYLYNAKNLSKSRKNAASKLSDNIQNELSSLKMSSVKFIAEINNLDEKNFSKNGIDKVKFKASTNISSRIDDINKIASGGELSRFMLALKVALSNVKSVPILIFDEIDSGIGGAVADAVGERLKKLSCNLQILVVTHHPQIAAKSDFHLKVEKISENNLTKTIISHLDDYQRELEIARMLSGENITNEAIAAAKKLL